MDIKDMRKALRDAGQPVPRSNADVMPAYYAMLKDNEARIGNETFPGIEKEHPLNVIENSAHVEVETSAEIPEIELKDTVLNLENPGFPLSKNQSIVKLASTNIYTYIGSGDEPPHMINFMGMQKFIRGQAVEVKNPVVIDKINSHRCFVKGKVDQEKLFESDEKEKARADEQRNIDQQTQARIDRVNKG